MISEIAYIRDFASFWRQTTPLMDGFVRRLNRELCTRDFKPMVSETSPNRRGFVNEVAFSVFCELVSSVQRGSKFSSKFAIEKAAKLVSRQASREFLEGNYDPNLSEIETSDIEEQIDRLYWKLVESRGVEAVTSRPQFKGCGIVDKCEGDLLIQKTLFEIKAGDRPFRAIDLRQLLTYLALNRASGSPSIEGIGLVNPRVGVSFEMLVDEFSFEVSGRDPASLMESVVYGMSSGDISR